jgi:isoleucyl-tRNA synthetase
MPYGSIHYPYENQEKYKRDFPADFIAEGIDQTRGWFYSLLVLSTALEGVTSYKNVVVNGTALAENGQKMSKHLKNYPDPTFVMDKYGADAMRFYLMASSAVKAGDLCFSEKGVEEVVKNLILRLWNSYSFFVTYASLDNFQPTGKLTGENVLDKWMLSVTNQLVANVTKAMEKYEISVAARYLNDFIEELSNWYIRRSRKRFWKSENDSDKTQAYETLYFVLVTYVKLLAPFMPFITEEIYQNLVATKDKESVHLDAWPTVDKENIDKELEENMAMVRQAVELGLSKRAEAGIKVRQPLSEMVIYSTLEPKQNLLDVVAEEVNVKKVTLKKKENLEVELDTKITPELKAEGIARDYIRFVQDARKKAGFNVEDRISLSWKTTNQEVDEALIKQKDYIAKETLALEINSKKEDYEYEQTVKFDGNEVWLGISRVNQ